MCDILQTDDKNLSNKKLDDLKQAIEPNISVYQKFIKRVYKYKEYW